MTKIEDMGLSVRTANCLLVDGMRTKEDVRFAWAEHGAKYFLRMQNFGRVSLNEMVKRFDLEGENAPVSGRQYANAVGIIRRYREQNPAADVDPLERLADDRLSADLMESLASHATALTRDHERSSFYILRGVALAIDAERLGALAYAAARQAQERRE